MVVATYIAVTVPAVVALALLCLYLLIRRSLPKLDGTLRATGLHSKVIITRDRSGVPCISASTRTDGYYAFGYVHAQDRLWQMELQRRLARGTLAEIMGKGALPADRYTRTLGLTSYARECWSRLGSTTRADIDAYVSGINQFIATAPAYGPEFTLLRVAPQPWSGTDVLSLGKLLGWTICSSHVLELLRSDLLEIFTREQVDVLLRDFGAPPLQRAAPLIFEPFTTIRVDAPAPSIAQRELIGAGQGSNLWVIGPERSHSGHAVLANDPHLAITAPSQLYVVQVRAGELHFAGASVPGIPAVISGHNNFIAWGVTNLAPDVQDLYWEKLNTPGTHYLQGSTERPLTCTVERIHVKAGKPVQLEVKSTSRGPLICDVLQGDTEEHRRERGVRPPLSLQWTGFNGSDRSLEALMRMNAASNWEEFRDALRLHSVPPLNFGFADKDGNIGLQAAGLIPVRHCGDGSVPGDGSAPDSGWKGFIPYDDLPRSFNPACGYIVSINSSAPENADGKFLGRDWIRATRRQRIEQLITARTKLAMADHYAIQKDCLSPEALQLVAAANLILQDAEFPENVERLQHARKLLAAWDGTMDRASVPAALFAAWHLHATNTLLDAVVGAKLAKAYRHWTSYTNELLLDVLSGRVLVAITPQDLVSGALQCALRDLTARCGMDMSRWTWGAVHRALFSHAPFSYFPLIRRLFTRSVSCSGYSDTVNIAGVTSASPYTSRVAAAYRQVIEMTQPIDSWFCGSLGQSAHPLSAHYDDLLEDWADCRHRKLPLGSDETPTDHAHRLTLLPVQKLRDQ